MRELFSRIISVLYISLKQFKKFYMEISHLSPMMASILDDNSFIFAYEKYEGDVYLSMKIFRAIIFNVCNLN